MALKPHRKVIADDINFKCKNVCPKGVLVIYSTTAGFVERPTLNGGANPSGKKVAGVLMIDVVNKAAPSLLVRTGGDPLGTVDNTALLNPNKTETHTSGTVRLLKVGECMTNSLDPSDTFAQGDTLYITNSGLFSKVQDNSGIVSVGRSLGAKDSDGYLKVWISL